MNRSRGLAASAIGAFVVAAVALGAGLALAPVGAARAAPAPLFTLEFTGLTPGVPQTESSAFQLDRAATLASFAWLEQTGVMASIALDIEVCDSTGSCVDPTALGAGFPFAAGTVSVAVTAELAQAAGNGETGSIVGQLTFVADDDLAFTGANAAPWAATALAALAVGALLLALLRRREDSSG